MTVLHAPSVRPVRVSDRDERLQVDASRVVAYRGVCSCGWRGASRPTHRAARDDYRYHVRQASPS